MAMRMSNSDFRETVPDSGEPAAPAERVAKNEQVGQYLLLDLLGRGGMGSVYKARHVLLDRVVALKLLAPARLADPQAVGRFLREIKAVGKLDHPNLVRGTDAGQADGRHFLVMEFLQGIDLGKLVLQLGPLPVADACELVRQAALGLQHAHEHKLVHRDVKPSNLLLTPGGQVKVLDLGLARLMGEVPLGDELTDTGQYMGTADYMAPEQGFDAHAVDTRADVYSLGCTLYKLLTGRAPFSGPEYDSTFKKIRAHAQIPIPPVRDTRPDVPEALAEALGRMLAKLPVDRFATPAEAAEALRPFATESDLNALLTRTRALNEISTSEPSPLPLLPYVTPVLTPKACGSTKPAPRIPAPGKRIRYILVGTLLIGLLSVLLFWIVANRPTGPKVSPNTGVSTPPRGVERVPDEPAPGDWRDLMARAPAKLDWPRDERMSPVRYTVPGEPLWATCTNACGLLAFGQTGAVAYELEMEFFQMPWSGSVGLFFGYHVAAERGKEIPTYQFLKLHLKDPQGPGNRFQIVWENMVIREAPKGPVPRGAGSWSTSAVFDPGRTAHRLRAVITDHGLEGVYWDGDRLSMNTALPPVLRERIRFQGIFGVCLFNNTTSITQFRYRSKVR
jgi:serine/threonine protein kinase